MNGEQSRQSISAFSKQESSEIADARRGDGKRYVVRADEKLTAFLELEGVTRTLARGPKLKLVVGTFSRHNLGL